MGSILHGLEVTEHGGETLFCNLYEAYAALPADIRNRIAERRARHSHATVLSRGQSLEHSAKYDELKPVWHPLVRRHPETGRLSLFISPHTMDLVEGMNEAESRALLDDLIAFAQQDRFVYRHKWARDDIIMWDNRCTMHAVTPFDNARFRRVMHRTTLVGDGPVLAA